MNKINVQQVQQLRANGFRVNIKHTVLDTPVTLRDGVTVKAITNCFIKGDTGMEFPQGTGQAFCGVSDQFSKGVGSSLAFTRAIANMDIPRNRAKELFAI